MPGAVGDRQYEAEITWTTHGVAHVTGSDWGNLGFGQGWACSRDHVASIADHVLKARSERSSFLGAGPGDRHLRSDLGYLALGVTERAERMAASQPAEIRDLVAGYTAGVNAWLAEHGSDAAPEWCRGAAWLRPLEPLDLWRVYVDLAIMASGRNLIDYIGSAAPPGAAHVGSSDVPLSGDPGMGSNAWAFGAATTANGRGMVMANPHFPWSGEGRFWECHLRIPGTLDTYGVSLVGTPLVQMGFNRDVGWAHTFSRGHRFTVYRLDLVDGDPTAYRYGSEERAMIPTLHSVDVRAEDGSVAPVERTLWSSHYGPMLDLPMLGWSEAFGFSFRDVNLDNDRFLGQVRAMNTSSDLTSFQEAIETHQGLPWVNTLAADRAGRCWYIDASTTPNLSAAAVEKFIDNVRNDPITQFAHTLRVALLDGSDPVFEWQDEPGAPGPGLLPFDRLPQLERDDHLFNSNDPYWLPHVEVQIPEHSPLCGLYHDHISPRSRMNALLASWTGPVVPTGPDGRCTADDVQDAVLGNHSLHAELLLDGVIERLRDAGTVEVDGRSTDVAAAAEILAGWDRRFDVDSVGAVLWRELLASFDEGARVDAGPLYAEPFDANDPVATPRGLAPAPAGHPDPLAAAAARGIYALELAGLAPDVPLGVAQFVERGGQRWPIHGGYEIEGIANVIAPVGTLAAAHLEPGPELPDPVPGRTERTGIRVGGYPAVYGVSFVMVLSFTDEGPEGRGLLVYGQSADPASPHHSDQLDDFAAKRLRPLLVTDEAIAGDPNRTSRTVVG